MRLNGENNDEEFTIQPTNGDNTMPVTISSGPEPAMEGSAAEGSDDSFVQTKGRVSLKGK